MHAAHPRNALAESIPPRARALTPSPDTPCLLAGRRVCKSGGVFVTSHVLSAVLIGRAARGRPVTAFAAGVGSHLALDALPHWGCVKGAEGSYDTFLRAAKRDGIAGLGAVAGAVVAADRRDRLSTVAAIAGAVLLDLDKPCAFFFGRNPFPRAVRRIHSRVQNESPAGMPNEIAYGGLLAATDAVVLAVGRAQGRRVPVGPDRGAALTRG